jgi:hypothetical protein
MDRRQALALKRNERVKDGERKSDTTETVLKCGNTRPLYVHSFGGIEEVWWVTRRSGLVRIRGAATPPTSCIRANVNEILVINGNVIRGRSQDDYGCRDIERLKDSLSRPHHWTVLSVQPEDCRRRKT